MLPNVLQSCREKIEQDNARDIFPATCDAYRRVELTKDDLCGLTFGPGIIETNEIDQLVTDCLPKHMFGTLPYTAGDYFIKRRIFEQAGLAYQDSFEAVNFAYQVAACDQDTVSVTGMIYIGSGVGEVYASVSMAAPCVGGVLSD